MQNNYLTAKNYIVKTEFVIRQMQMEFFKHNEVIKYDILTT